MTEHSEYALGGLEQLQQRLDDLGGEKGKSIMRKALRAGAKVFQRQAVDDAPSKSGTLRQNIKVRSGKRSKNSISMICGVGKAWWTGPSWYAAAIEFGWRWGKRKISRSKQKAGGTDTRKQIPGTHFMEKAFNKSSPQAVATIIEVSEELIELAEGKSAGGTDA